MAGGIVKIKITKAQRKLKNHGFLIEYLLVSFVIITVEADAKQAIQA
jgi:hypothetical protein